MVIFFCFSLANVKELKCIYLGEEGESLIYYSDDELYFVLPYVGEYAILDRTMLSVDADGFLKFTFKNKKILIIDGDYINQCFLKFQNDGDNKYIDSNYGFHNSNIKNITASSSYSEIINGRKISYTPDNLYKCFFVGCKCHPYWWNDAHIPWVEGANGNGINETITIEYKEPVEGVSILNGYTDINNMKLFKENSRLKKIRIDYLDSGQYIEASFEDKVYFKYIPFVKPTSKIRITILDVYPGTKYSDTCVSAIIEHRRVKKALDERSLFNERIKNLIKENTETVLSDYFKGKDLFTNKYKGKK